LKKDLSQIQKLSEKLDDDVLKPKTSGSTEIKLRIDGIGDLEKHEELSNVIYTTILIEYISYILLIFEIQNLGKESIGSSH